MARKGATSTQRLGPPPVTNGNPPSSTITAQIVDKASNRQGQQQSEISPEFFQLLDQFLNEDQIDEDDAKVVGFIAVVAEAGLDKIPEDRLFAPELRNSQIIKCITAIKFNIQRKPYLLLSARDESSDGAPQPPLILWMFPKFLKLLGHPDFASLQELLKDLISTCLTAFSQSPSRWRHAASLLQLCRSCVDSILAALEPSDATASEISTSRCHVVLPPPNSISDLWPDSQNVVALPQGSQRTITSRSHAVLLGFNLIQSILDYINSQSVKDRAYTSVTCDNYIPWALDCCCSLWTYYKQSFSHLPRDRVHDCVETAFMQSLEAMTLPRGASVEMLLSFPKASIALSTSLSDLVQACSSSPFSQSNQIRLASMLTRLRALLETLGTRGSLPRHCKDLKNLMTDNMALDVLDICQNVTKLRSLEKDLQLALCLWTSLGDWPPEVLELRNTLRDEGTRSFSDSQLQQDSTSIVGIFKSLSLADGERPNKRQRVIQHSDREEFHPAYRTLVMTLTGSTRDTPILELSGLHNFIVDTYLAKETEPEQHVENLAAEEYQRRREQARENSRCRLLSAFGKIACAGSRCLQLSPDNTNWDNFKCCICDDTQSDQHERQIYWNDNESSEDWKDVIAALLAITGIKEFRESKKSRILMALAIRRAFNHISHPDYLVLDTQSASLGQWLLTSMSSSIRQLRISAAQALMVFLRDDVPKKTRDKNRMLALGFFNTLSQENKLPVQETLIMAYGQAARVCGEDELPIILLQIVEYLGHTNPIICGTAYSELLSIADVFKMNVLNLLRPYWGSIGFAVAKDLHNKPQKAQQLSDLTEQSVSALLLSAQSEILPRLVLTKRKDILQRIATARGTSIQDVCTQPRRNLAGILALLLCQTGPDVEKSAMETLTAIAPAFQQQNYDLSSWVKLDPVLVACEILKTASDQHESRRKQYRDGFRLLAALAETKNGQRRTSSTKKTLASFFEIHVLGIMAHFSMILDDPQATYPMLEKKRCVGAIGEMITLAGSCASFALPQIRACLQSAMTDAHLRDQTFLVWTILLTALEEEDLELVVDQTFALIAQNWPFFSDDTHEKAYEFLMTFVKNNDALLRERIDHIPSLASIPVLSKLEAELVRLKDKVDRLSFLNTFSQRCNDEDAVVVRQALKELVPFLEANQKLLHDAATSQKPLPTLPTLTRSLLDACVRFTEGHDDIPVLCAQCLGLIGGLDPYKVEAVRDKKHIVVLYNFEQASEVLEWTTYLLEHVLVKVFHSATNARAQGFLAYVMQELLKFCGYTNVIGQRPRSSQASPALQRWNEIPEAVQSTLTPFLTSRYMIQSRQPSFEAQEYPIFNQEISHSSWLRTFAYDLLRKGKGDNPQMIFPVLARLIRSHDLSIATFILPFAVHNVIITGDEQETANVGNELLTILETEIQASDQTDATRIKQCSENVFQILDYLALWLQEKRKAVADARAMAGKTGRGISETDEIRDIAQISCVERILQMIPAEVISRRAVECGSYARALYHWEQYYRQEQAKAEAKGTLFAKDELLQHLQFIYAQIDEPDSIEGISAHLQVLNTDQQIIEHRKAGRWTAAQSWYELALAEKPNDTDTQINLLTCLKESGQYDSILNYVDGFHASNSFSPSTLPFAAEAAWSTGKWDQLEKILTSPSEQSSTSENFNVGVGKALLALRRNQTEDFKRAIESLRTTTAKELSPTSTSSLHACHDSLVKLHVLYEVEAISGMCPEAASNREALLENLERRLDVLGAYTSDKQYLLGIRRAVMQLSNIDFTKLDIASAWLTTARLARKAEFTSTAFNSVLHAAQLGDDASKIEYSKLMWMEGHHRKAIQNLQGAIVANGFQARDGAVSVDVSVSTTLDQPQAPNKVKCHAELLLAKWLDRAGQTKSIELKQAYTAAVMSYPRWDKCHYYLGRHYLKLLESEKQLPVSRQSSQFVAGETAKLVIENFIRSVVYGTKYYYQTIPKILTLWLDLGMDVFHNSPRTTKDKEFHDYKTNYLEAINRHIKRYTNDRVPAYAWYTAFPQIITRISHPHKNVWEVLQAIIIKVTAHYPPQALWSLLAVTKATQDDRRSRGLAVLQKLRTETHKRKHGSTFDLKNLIIHGQRLTDSLLSACDAPVEQRVSHVSLSKDLGFNLKLAPCLLVVPIEATMIASLPGGIDSKVIRNHNPFPQDTITISSFMDDVLVLSSLQRPRKVNVRGSDGRSYGLLCKPKDDLRKDQRLMEFNAMINRALQRDIESSKRRLYIKTYGVTPLNEECGTIEWVEGLKPMRDIIIRLYRQKAVQIDYGELRMLLNEACSDPAKVGIFTDKILKNFQPVLYEWFIETFPEPEAWFAARLRYTRSCAVMSIVGHVLGLGDRHGENVLLEEGNGGTFHVDFNCLFDKGLTFEKPELVPFRLTHNMVDAMGPQGIEGPFRTAAELTYTQLRQHEDTLITILETFVHDPTADFLGGKRRKKIMGVPDTPQEVLESVRRKVAGFLPQETVPLSVEGYVDALVQMARDPRNLAAMYIGWCAFF